MAATRQALNGSHGHPVHQLPGWRRRWPQRLEIHDQIEQLLDRQRIVERRHLRGAVRRLVALAPLDHGIRVDDRLDEVLRRVRRSIAASSGPTLPASWGTANGSPRTSWQLKHSYFTKTPRPLAGSPAGQVKRQPVGVP
jgi:hypothetical protein